MEQPLPYNQDAELALLGAVLINPGILDELDLQHRDFYIHRHQWIWEACQAIKSRGGEPDFVTLTEELETRGRLNECGGPAFLANLVNSTPTSLGAAQYAEIVQANAQRRRAIQIGSELVKAAYDPQTNLQEVAGQVVDQLTMGIRPKSGAVHISKYLSDLYDETEERSKNPSDIWGLSTGILDFDKATGGLQPGEVLYIAGEPGVGKSILSMQMGFNMGAAYIPGAIYSLEMRGLQVARRAVSARSQIETRKIKSGKLEDTEWTVFNQAIEEMSAHPVYLSEEGHLTSSALRADLARLKARYGIQWFVLDYLFLMADGDGKIDDNDRSALLSRRIKAIALDLGLAGITVNSVTKDGMDTGKASKKTVRGSGEVIHAADLIGNLLPHQPAKGEIQIKNLRTFAFTKGRELEGLGFFHLLKTEKWPAFKDYAPDRKEPNAQRVAPMNGNGKGYH